MGIYCACLPAHILHIHRCSQIIKNSTIRRCWHPLFRIANRGMHECISTISTDPTTFTCHDTNGHILQSTFHSAHVSLCPCCQPIACLWTIHNVIAANHRSRNIVSSLLLRVMYCFSCVIAHFLASVSGFLRLCLLCRRLLWVGYFDLYIFIYMLLIPDVCAVCLFCCWACAIQWPQQNGDLILALDASLVIRPQLAVHMGRT